jgi:thymidine phosphorylase
MAAVAMELGAGRERKEDPVDHAVGVVCHAKRGDRVERGEPLAEVHARSEAAADSAEAALRPAYELGNEPEPRPLVLATIR